MSKLKSTKRFNPVSLEHPMHNAVTTRVENITPEAAASMLERNQKNRNLRSYVVGMYARDMLAGNWQMAAESIKFDWNGRLIDGQHRLTAVVESGVTVPMLVVRNLDPDVQTVIDAGAKRSAGDALKFEGMGGNPTLVAAISRIASVWEQGGLRSAASSLGQQLTNSEVIEWVNRTPDAHMAAALGSRYFKGIGTTPSALGFAALKFLEIDAEEAVEFLSSTAEMRTDGVNDPRVVLIRTLMRLKQERVRLTPALQLSLLFRAWNAWREDRQVTTLPLRSAGRRAVAIPEPK